MTYTLFLFDLDDTLLDFRASEQLSFERTLRQLGFRAPIETLFGQYQAINIALWRAFEAGTVSKDFLKVERFRQTFSAAGIDLNPSQASERYLESLSDTVVLIDGARQLCEQLAAVAEIGVITNGVDHIQQRRIAAAGLGDAISFVATSEACGFAKPDSRFFDYTVKMARAFSKAQTIIIGDRLDTDILGANRFGIDSCWYNPDRLANDTPAVPTFEVTHMDHILPMLAGQVASA